MNITIVSENYPTNDEPAFPFVQQLAYSLSNLGWNCSIVAPQSLTKILLRRTKNKSRRSIDYSPEGKAITIYRPHIVTFSNTKSQFLKRLYDWQWESSIRRHVKLIKDIDVLYCYFWHVGLTASIALKNKKDLPIFVQASECSITAREYMRTPEIISRISGVICASGKNKTESIAAGFTDGTNTVIAVNGFREDQFYYVDKRTARRKLGFPEDAFIVAFVGGFISRKGITRLSNVLDRFDDVSSIFIGSGTQMPTCHNILYCDKVPHEELVNYLSCADVFVLPTEAEGCCNAIIEAVACGIPVISSNKSFNDEIIDETCSIRIDEQSEEEIYNAIRELKENKRKRESLSYGALTKAKDLTIEHRASTIDCFLKKMIANSEHTE